MPRRQNNAIVGRYFEEVLDRQNLDMVGEIVAIASFIDLKRSEELVHGFLEMKIIAEIRFCRLTPA
jgi:hypothetical protein